VLRLWCILEGDVCGISLGQVSQLLLDCWSEPWVSHQLSSYTACLCMAVYNVWMSRNTMNTYTTTKYFVDTWSMMLL
jgi:hypothetical protein